MVLDTRYLGLSESKHTSCISFWIIRIWHVYQVINNKCYASVGVWYVCYNTFFVMFLLYRVYIVFLMQLFVLVYSWLLLHLSNIEAYLLSAIFFI